MAEAQKKESIRDIEEIIVRDLGDQVVIEKIVDGMRVSSYFPKKREGSKENLENFKKALMNLRS